jgi:hypothetical protein
MCLFLGVLEVTGSNPVAPIKMEMISSKQVTKTIKRHEQALEAWFRVVPVLFLPGWKAA